MISFTPNEWFNTIWLGPFLLILLLAVIALVKYPVEKAINFIVQQLEFRKRMKTVVEMKAAGDFHEWITMAVSINPPKNAKVCKKTGFCPELYGFFDVKYVQDIAKAQEKAREYNLYKNRRLADIALELKMDFDDFMALIDRVNSIPKDYTVSKLDDLQKELKAVGENIQ